MSGVWEFKDGVVRLLENPGGEAVNTIKVKQLVHIPSERVIGSYLDLEVRLSALGWERNYDDYSLIQFQKKETAQLISLPRDFRMFDTTHMDDIVLKNPNMFEVREP